MMGSSSTERRRARTRVGLAYCSYVADFIDQHAGAADYVEVPFERLRANPGCAVIGRKVPIVLHSASLSMAGVLDPAPRIARELVTWVRATGTPWVGEHLAFVTAPAGTGKGDAYDVGYTVAPPLDEETLARVARNVRRYTRRLGVPVLLENPPQYFVSPGSTMSQVEFLRRLCAREEGVALLLDLTHLQITADNLGFDARAALAELPLDRVIEVHVSGISRHGGASWDDHAERAPPRIFDLLCALASLTTNVRAATLEYNWSSRFPTAIVAEDLAALREAFAVRRVA